MEMYTNYGTHQKLLIIILHEALYKPLQGYNREKEYIASQGPLPDTVGDFWRLVWDYNIPTIVMLTNLMEKMKVKCSQYWPNTGSQQYANINVTLINTIQQADFTIRHFQIKSVSFFSHIRSVGVLIPADIH